MSTTKHTKTSLNRMSVEDLKVLAIQECGEMFDEDATKKDVLKVLIKELVPETKTKEDDAKPDDTQPADNVAEENEPGEEYCYLMLSSDATDGRASGDQFLSVNHYDVLVTYGKWAKVKRKIVTMLEELTMTTHETVTDDNNKMKTIATESLRFNFLHRTLEQGPGKAMKRSGSTSVGQAY